MAETKRHQPHSHHWSMTLIALCVAAALVIILVLTYGQAEPTAHLEPPKGSMSHEVDTAASGMAQDLNQLGQVDASGVDLNEAALAQ
jgi:hypothetical protein